MRRQCQTTVGFVVRLCHFAFAPFALTVVISMKAEEFRVWRDGVIAEKGGCCVRCGCRTSLELCRWDGMGRKVSKVRSLKQNIEEARHREPYCTGCRKDLTPHPRKDTPRSETRKKQDEWRERRAKWFSEVARRQVIEQKGGKCVDCGATEFLELDHVNPAEKSFAISSGPFRSLESISQEIEKCTVRCNRCHIEKSKTDRLYVREVMSCKRMS